MGRSKIFIFLFITVFSTAVNAQVKIRLFANQSPESAVFSVVSGKYSVNAFNGERLTVSGGDAIIISRFDGKLAVKTRNTAGLISDSAVITGLTGNDSFSLRLNGRTPVKQFYSGDLKCFPDLETLVLINICDIEKYIAGVVMAEGGNGKNAEYFQSQAVIARTYMYKYFDKHMQDGYNVCDNTHCQAFNGISGDSLIMRATLDTKDMVILDHDSTLIISAFHSNCGGQTASSEDVWLSGQSYLKSVVDPYCVTSRNAEWTRKLSLHDWIDYLKRSGYKGTPDDPSLLGFVQRSRSADYVTGTFRIPFRTIRADLNLRSAFFSVLIDGDSVILKGRGYGHGVGLCQEGAMVMAAKGYNYRQIIDFYYSGVMISDIKNAVILPSDRYSQTP
jgi:stage II sporulation protein D